MMSKILLFAGLFVFVPDVWAQHDPQYAQYLANPAVVNPAYTGVHNRMTAAVNYRTQRMNIEDSPETFTASVYSSLYGNAAGGGLILVQDEAGFVRTNEVYLVSAYKIAGPVYTVSFGLQGGIISRRLDYSRLTLDPDAMDDPEFSGAESNTRPNFGAGLMLVSDRLLAGISSPRLAKGGFSEGGRNHTSYQRYFYGMCAYIFPIDFDTMMKPSLLLRVSGDTPPSWNLAISWIENQMYAAGFFTRSLQTIGFSGGFTWKQNLQLTYSFEIPVHRKLGFQYNTHELSLRIDMKALAFHQMEFGNF